MKNRKTITYKITKITNKNELFNPLIQNIDFLKKEIFIF